MQIKLWFSKYGFSYSEELNNLHDSQAKQTAPATTTLIIGSAGSGAHLMLNNIIMRYYDPNSVNPSYPKSHSGEDNDVP